MQHLIDNIKIIRSLYNESQPEFIKRFTGVTLSMQKSYERGSADPGILYITELAEPTTISEKQLISRRIKKEEVIISDTKEEIVPRELQRDLDKLTLGEQGVPYGKKLTALENQNQSLQAILNLTEANKVLANNNERLVRMLEQDRDAPKKISG